MDTQTDMFSGRDFCSNVWMHVCGFPAKKVYDIIKASHGDVSVTWVVAYDIIL